MNEWKEQFETRCSFQKRMRSTAAAGIDTAAAAAATRAMITKRLFTRFPGKNDASYNEFSARTRKLVKTFSLLRMTAWYLAAARYVHISLSLSAALAGLERRPPKRRRKAKTGERKNGRKIDSGPSLFLNLHLARY